MAIGPAIENGFYYDMDAPFGFNPEILEKIEMEMPKICKEKLELKRSEVSRKQALELIKWGLLKWQPFLNPILLYTEKALLLNPKL